MSVRHPRGAIRIPRCSSLRASICAARASRRRSSCSTDTSTQLALAEAEKVTIIHGHGSGALRDALRAQLRTHPLVKSWRAGDRHEGGDGATIVEF